MLASTSWTDGRVNFDSVPAFLGDTLHEAGSYQRWNANLSRLQNIGGQRFQWYGSVMGQWAQKNLDPSQKMVVGGPFSVRAYQMGILSADSGFQGTMELHYRLNDHWQAIAFEDNEEVTISQNPLGSKTNSATLNGAGAGFNWHGGPWQSQIYVATRLGSVPALLASTNPGSTLIWGEMTRGF